MAYSRLRSLRNTAIILVLGCISAGAQVLRGNVINGTTKKPQGGDEVVLLRLDNGMEEQAHTKANSRGEFSFQLPDSQVMRAVRVRHQNVNYFQPVQPGSATVAVTVYESSDAVQGVRRADQWVVFQARGDKLQGFEIFDIKNESNPPRTQPAFDFYLPEGASVDGATALREGGMSLKVAPVPQGGNKYTIIYPLMPGQSHFEVVYNLPYAGNLNYQPKFAGPVGTFGVFTPKSMQFNSSSPLFQASDPRTVAPDMNGMDLHIASNPGDGSQLAFQIAGEGIIPQDTGQQAAGQTPGQEAPENNRPGIGLGPPTERPNPLTTTQPWFLVILTLFMAGGGAFIYMTSASNPGLVPAGKSHGSSAGSSLLDALKEEMFQLEADRVHGKVSAREYEVAKAALDKTLQRAIKRK